MHVYRRHIAIVLFMCLYGESKESSKSCSKKLRLSTRIFTSWYKALKKNQHDWDNNVNETTTKQFFYKAFARSAPFHCIVQKSIGGNFNTLSSELVSWCELKGNCETWPQIDGVKKICLDTLYKSVVNQTCLVYSFGLSDDWSFEEVMANFGCKVRSFDPTIQGPPNDFRYPDNLSFKKTGISNETTDIKLLKNMGSEDVFHVDTLENIINENNDLEKTIYILKLDVEGYEFQVLPQILERKVMNYIDQIIVEVHSNDHQDRSLEDMSSILKVITTMHSKGFSIVSYDPNLTIGSLFSSAQKYYSNFDITLSKTFMKKI